MLNKRKADEMRIQEFVNKTVVTKYFILDSHDQGTSGQNGVVYADEDFVQYSYEPKQNNKLTINSAFLYRKPGKSFQIIGGGLINSISTVDTNGYKIASVSNGFKLLKPLEKGDPFLENFVWKNKSKPGIGWKGFWTNYGILEITEDDFWGLLSALECIPAIPKSKQTQDAIEDLELVSSVDESYLTMCASPVVNIGPKTKPTEKSTSSKVYPRDRKVAQNALNNAHHKCEVDASHISFMRRQSPIQYTEPHHLVPMSFQSSFDYSLDREENIVALCSNCHNNIHYGADAKELIKKLYKSRINDLKRVGIDIDLNTLLAMYKL